MKAHKIGRNDPCWCGSGRKYKKCHLGRHISPVVPFAAIKSAIEHAWDEKRCLHPLASANACDQIVSAHTIQRSTVLRRLIDERNHVRTFYRAESDEPSIVGWKKASTFPGFCSRHDRSTFRPIEEIPFTGTPAQCFLVGYRALCHQIHQKRAAIRQCVLLKNLGDKGHPLEVQRMVQRHYAMMEAGTRKGLEAFAALKASMDRQLIAEEFSGWSRLIVRFNGSLCVASTGGRVAKHGSGWPLPSDVGGPGP